MFISLLFDFLFRVVRYALRADVVLLLLPEGWHTAMSPFDAFLNAYLGVWCGLLWYYLSVATMSICAATAIAGKVITNFVGDYLQIKQLVNQQNTHHSHAGRTSEGLASTSADGDVSAPSGDGPVAMPSVFAVFSHSIRQMVWREELTSLAIGCVSWACGSGLRFALNFLFLRIAEAAGYSFPATPAEAATATAPPPSASDDGDILSA